MNDQLIDRVLPALFAGALLVSAAQAEEAEVTKVDGAILRGVEIVQDGLKELSYKRGSRKATIPSLEVRSITWKKTPDSFARAEIAMENGDAETAANLFAEAADQGKSDAFKAASRFLAVDALVKAAGASANKARTAAQAAQRWCDDHPQHRLQTTALRLLGRAEMTAGNAPTAKLAFEKLEKLATSNALGPIWIGEAKLGQGLALMAQKQFGDARKTFVGAYTIVSRLDPKTMPEATPLSVQIKIAQGECYIEEGKLEDARRFYEGLSSLATRSPAFKTASLCGLGQALYQQGVKDKDIKKLRNAQKLFAEVSATDLLDGDTSAKALYLMGRTLLALGKDHEGKDYASRAMGIFRQIQTCYSDSRWATLARKALGG
ncbi:MAG: hypothetical protein CSA62_10380 [Planctomycetota bacterium]|nr:MAG: hypothetical protein CSA62_10380 [Planctomycetota bacterium]